MSALRKVLVVDDDPVIARSFTKVLSRKGYAVITAANGEEALNKLATDDYDVVYTDIKMPGMSGLEVAERVKAKCPWTPVVIITGYGTAAHEARANAAGVSGFLHKPLSPDMIEESAREVVAAAEPAEEAAEIPARKESVLKNIALFFAAPFIALAYIIAFPFVGAAMLAWFAVKAAAKRRVGVTIGKVARNTGLLVAAPFIALGCLVLFPFMGLGMLAWFGGRAAWK